MLIAAAEGASSGSGNILVTLAPFIIMFAVFYFLLIRPQQRKSKVRNSMLSSLKKGDKVTTIGGLHGTILEISDDIVVLRVNDATKLTFDRASINNVTTSAVESTEE
ncbi:MAG: preprotein translocase subunit YajC [Paenibacillaceae bacterium]